MLKGAHKQMIVVRTHDSRLFEEAYFVMRRGARSEDGDELDMLWEANRIIESSLPPAGRREAGTERRRSTAVATEPQRERESRFGLFAGLVWFGLGFLGGGGLVGFLWLLL